MTKKKEKEVLVPEVVDDTPSKSILAPEAMLFATAIASGMRMDEAYIMSHPDKASSKWVSAYANRLAKNPKVKEHIALIQEATRLQIVLAAPEAFNRLKELSETAKSEKVRLDATRDLLDRGGLEPPRRVETLSIGVFGSLSSEDMRNIIRGKLTRSGEETDGIQS